MGYLYLRPDEELMKRMSHYFAATNDNFTFVKIKCFTLLTFKNRTSRNLRFRKRKKKKKIFRRIFFILI